MEYLEEYLKISCKIRLPLVACNPKYFSVILDLTQQGEILVLIWIQKQKIVHVRIIKVGMLQLKKAKKTIMVFQMVLQITNGLYWKVLKVLFDAYWRSFLRLDTIKVGKI